MSDFVNGDDDYENLLRELTEQHVEEERVRLASIESARLDELKRLKDEEARLESERLKKEEDDFILASIESARLEEEMAKAIELSKVEEVRLEKERLKSSDQKSGNLMSYENIIKSLGRDIRSYKYLKNCNALDDGQSFKACGKTYLEQCGLIAFLQGVLLAYKDSPNNNLPDEFVSLIQYYEKNGRDETLFYLYDIIDRKYKQQNERVSILDLRTLAYFYSVRLEIITGGDDNTEIVGDEGLPHICLANIGNHYVVNIGNRQSVPVAGDVISFKQIFQNLGITKDIINELIAEGIIEKYDPIFDEIIQRDIYDIAAECGAIDGCMTDEQLVKYMSLLSFCVLIFFVL
jgi:hypothetical protein